MAEGGELPSSFKDYSSRVHSYAHKTFSAASACADELFCDPCQSDDEWKAVEGYCQVCQEYYCDTCLGMHRRQKLTKTHIILNKKQMPTRQRSQSNQDLCVEVCETHHPEIIRFYCKVHDEPGCGDCMTLMHTICQKGRLQDISDGFQTSKEFQDIDQHFKQLHQELEEMEGELENNFNKLDTTYNKMLHKIQSVREQINKYLDEMEKKIIDKAAQMKKEDETELKRWIAENQEMKAETEAMLQTIHDVNVNVNSLFVISKRAKRRLVAMEREIDKIKKSQQNIEYGFLISDEIENIIAAKTPLGKLSRKSQKLVRKLTTRREQRTRSKPTVHSTAIYNRSINVKCATDKKTCYVTDLTLLGADRMVVADRYNNTVKLVDISNNKVISSYNTPSEPWGVTALGPNTIAVTLFDDGKLQVLIANVTSTFSLQREIKVKTDCQGIAYKDGKLAVSYLKPGRVEILNIQGKRLHTIQPKQGKAYLLQLPFYITFGHDNDTVIISDYSSNRVSVVTFKGQILRTYTNDTLKNPYGIVTTGDGVLFICSCLNGLIHAVSPDFKTSQIIINDNHVLEPVGITYCEINHTLFISNIHRYFEEGGDINNQIQVYDIND